jgi:hypothetical protein
MIDDNIRTIYRMLLCFGYHVAKSSSYLYIENCAWRKCNLLPWNELLYQYAVNRK